MIIFLALPPPPHPSKPLMTDGIGFIPNLLPLWFDGKPKLQDNIFSQLDNAKHLKFTKGGGFYT